MSKGKYITIGNGSFDKEQISMMTMTEFKGAFAGLLKGHDIETVAKQLGIKPDKKAKAKKAEPKMEE